MYSFWPLFRLFFGDCFRSFSDNISRILSETQDFFLKIILGKPVAALLFQVFFNKKIKISNFVSVYFKNFSIFFLKFLLYFLQKFFLALRPRTSSPEVFPGDFWTNFSRMFASRFIKQFLKSVLHCDLLTAMPRTFCDMWVTWGSSCFRNNFQKFSSKFSWCSLRNFLKGILRSSYKYFSTGSSRKLFQE